MNSTDVRGLTPVMLAVVGGHLETAVQLALGGADLARRDQQGRTAIELAVLSSNREVCKTQGPAKPLRSPQLEASARARDPPRPCTHDAGRLSSAARGSLDSWSARSGVGVERSLSPSLPLPTS